MTVVTGRIWCGCRNLVLIINPLFLKQEHVFAVNSDKNSSINCIVTSALSVWLAIERSAVAKLYHAHSFACLMEVNISPTVTKALAGCDDIIRQHKLSCLRITALLCCKDLLWVGTSAGVLVYIPIPHVNHFTTKVTSVRNISHAIVGHSGPCRFLVSVDLNDSSLDSHIKSLANACASKEGRRRRTSLNVGVLQQKTVYVISGGEGCEDLQDTTNDENDDSFGIDDSTNFLLMWKT
ncbi:unnamed protein product [Soboliphyme baturini]|uniref:Rho guanine nucleotide exchange factor 17 n=1 Tax=Soboliphyme baturini TaxID=241478 RepID=A0A183J8V3_9BILA|nr:unnamed protein product [Soboliphyme baturini]